MNWLTMRQQHYKRPEQGQFSFLDWTNAKAINHCLGAVAINSYLSGLGLHLKNNLYALFCITVHLVTIENMVHKQAQPGFQTINLGNRCPSLQ